MRLRRALFAIGLGLCAAASGVSAYGAADADAVGHEEQLKAAYVFNFVKFVDWPLLAADSAMTICFIGADGVRVALACGIEKKKVERHALAVRSLALNEAPDGCHVVYLDAQLLSHYP